MTSQSNNPTSYIRKEVIGDCTLYLGDCLDIIPNLAPVDHIITDPPYEEEAHTPMRRTNKSIKQKKNDVIDFPPITERERSAITFWSKQLCQGWALYFCQVEATSKWKQSIIEVGGKYKRSMVWIKPDSSPQFNGQGPVQGYECISVSWLGEGKSIWNAGGKRGVYTHNCNSNRVIDHSTEKPLPLMKELISDFTQVGDLVLDMYMGGGTTGVGCVELGRKFIGVEIVEKDFDMSCERISQAERQGDLFRPKAIQEALPL